MSTSLLQHYFRNYSIQTITTLALKFIALFFLIPSLNNHTNHLANADLFIYGGCSEEKFDPNSPFEGSLNSFLASIVSSSSQVIYNSFDQTNGSSTQTETALYGLYQCRGHLRTLECQKCVQSAVNQIGLICPYSYGAVIQLEGCYVRYEHDTEFLGNLDTSLAYKKCSRNVDADGEFIKRRDYVLADLLTTVGFKVSSSGLVQGYAQCLGDLSPSDCSSCLQVAVGRLKSICGSAAAADVFLAQCYARYWASGYYDFPRDSSQDDQAGKTVAIIVGIVAGLAILIILLSICQKAMGRDMKK